MTGLGERLFALLLLAYPAEFRRRYRADLVAFFREDRRHPKYGRGPGRPIRFWVATIRDLAQSAADARLSERRRRTVHGLGGHRAMSTPSTPIVVAAARHLRTDLRYAWRSLRATPGATLVALLVLMLGIGASTAIFAVADAIAFRDLPFGHADALVRVSEVDLDDGGRLNATSQNFLDWRARQDVFDGLEASSFISLVVRDGDRAERVLAVNVTPNLFGLLQVAPRLGRLFTESDAVPGQDQVAILSDGFWRRQFAADPDVIGRTLTFAGGTRQIVGVMPPGFEYPLGSRLVSSAEFWMPLVFTARSEAREGVGRSYNLHVVGRLRADVTVERAAAQMSQIRDALAAEYPAWFENVGIVALPLKQAVVGPDVWSWMLLLLAGVAFVLVIACVNVANVLLTRAHARARDLGIRAALGATRADLVRGVMVESLLLAGLGALGGLVLAVVGIGALRVTLPDNLPRLTSIALDLRVFLAASFAGLATGVLFGLVPALKLSRPEIAATLRESGRANTATAGQQRLRSALVVIEVGLAIVLLVGAGLFASSFLRILNRDLGFDPRGVLSVNITAAQPDPAGLDALLERIALMPGVTGVAAVGSGLPLSGSYRTFPLTVPGIAEPFTGDHEPSIREVTPSYLNVLRLSLLHGRWFTAEDTAGAASVVVLSDQAARRYFPGRDAIGQTVGFDKRQWLVVGVVAGTRFLGPEAEPSLEAYVPLAQTSVRSAHVAVRTEGSPPALAPALRAMAWETMSGAVVSEVQTLDRYYGTLVAQRRFNTFLTAIFGVLALAIVSVGIFGVMACLVDQRTQEIGVRMALGARPSGILRMVLGRTGVLAAIGLSIGLACAALLEQTMRSFLFQPKPFDPAVYVAAPVLVLALALVAAFVPARRASRVDPLIALRRQ